MSNPKVKSIDEAGILSRLSKSGDKETINYIRALKESNSKQYEITCKAIAKLKEVSLENESLKADKDAK